MLQYCEDNRDCIYMNKKEINNKIKCKELKERLEEIQKENMREAEQFVWKPTMIEMRRFITEEIDYVVSKTMKSSTGSRFYCEMKVKEHKAKRYGVISLTIFRLPSKQNQATISCQFYCKQMEDFYVRFDDIVIKMDGDENNAKQIAFFEWRSLEKALQRQQIEWNIVVIHKHIQRVMNVYNENENIVKEIINRHEFEAMKLYDELNNNIISKYLPLHRFNENHVCDVIKCWIFNDIQFKEELKKIMHIFCDYSLSGERIMLFSMNNIRRMLERELLAFIKKSTFDIILRKIAYWKNVDDENIMKKRTEEIAYILYIYPVNKLLARILNKNDVITGRKYIEYYQEKYKWIKNVTGWHKIQIYQIHCVLFKYCTLSSLQMKQNAKRILSQRLDEITADVIYKCFKSYTKTELETISYKIKNGSIQLHEFSDKIMEITSQMNQNRIKHVYEAIAYCFVPDYTQLSDAPSKYTLHAHSSWRCANCSNYNFSYFINGAINTNITICSLCGIKQPDAVIMTLKHYDTYTMINSMHDSTHKKELNAKYMDDIDDVIQSVITDHGFNLFCLSRKDNKSCPVMMRLAKQLIIYKRWIIKIKDNILTTTQMDIEKYITNDQFQDVFNQCIHSNNIISKQQNAICVLKKLLTDNKMNKSVFLSLRRKQFGAMIAKCINVKRGVCLSLYTKIVNSLKDKAQTEQFGALCVDFKAGIIDADYHHVLESHIKNGNKTTLENALRFFQTVVHYNDPYADRINCRSMSRLQETEILYTNNNNNNNDDEKDCTNPMTEDKDIWSANQYYIQNQLDTIHSFLVHSNWKYFINRYVINDEDDSAAVDENELNDTETQSERMQQNKNKFVSNLQESQLNSNYGFGVDHQHAYMKPKYVCMRDELLFNTLYAMTPKVITCLLTKALKKHQIALRETPYKNNLVCKYYRKEFNLIRNQSICIRHILALVAYTDDSKFCTALRKTYRRIDNETTEDQVIERHEQIYYCGRNLYESIEFFGQRMKTTDKVYHGLNQVMFFQEFTAYFSQPLSTTKSRLIAHQFAQMEGAGIVLKLKSGTEHEQNVSKIPKYLSVAWLSQYPTEDELLFYGDNVLFKICDIFETHNNVNHVKDLMALNEFQNIVHNRNIDWIETKAQSIIQRLCDFIENQIHINVINIYRKGIAQTQQTYAQNLFGYFCNHPNITTIGINNYNALPVDLKKQLLLWPEQKDANQAELAPAQLDPGINPLPQAVIDNFIALPEFDVVLFEDNIIQLPEDNIVPLPDDNIVQLPEDNIVQLPEPFIRNEIEFKQDDMLQINADNVDVKGNDDGRTKQNQEKTIVLKLTLVHLVNLFSHLKEIKFTNLNLSEMLEHKESYIDAVMEYITVLSYDVGSLLKVVFQSESQHDRKDNTALKWLVNKKKQIFKQHEWEINYIFDLTNTLTHCLTFINNATVVVQHHDKSFDDTANTDSVLIATPTTQPINCKWMHILSYFIQVTSIKQDLIYIKLISATINKSERRFRMHHIENDLKSGMIINALIILPKHSNMTTSEISIDTQSTLCHFTLFDSKNTNEPLSNTNEVCFEMLRNKNEFPPINMKYKPQAVDISTVFCVKDEKNSYACVYWSLPSFSFGDISYKIVNDSDTDQDAKENEIISSLPHLVPLSKVPVSFKIITQCAIEGKLYASHASDAIIVSDSNQATFKKSSNIGTKVREWKEFPNVLQILSVDSDQIEIKFALKEIAKRKMQCIIQSVDDNNNQKNSHQLSETMTVRPVRDSKAKDIDTKADTKYTFAIFLNGKRISNIISVRTPAIDFDPNDSYLPPPPSIETIKKYYDESKQNILMMWDYPQSVFGDIIIYAVKSSNNKQYKKVHELPYRMPVFANENIDINIRTIAIIDEKRFEGIWSETIHVAASVNN